MNLFIDCRMLDSGGIGSYLQSVLPFFTSRFACTLLVSQNQKIDSPSYNQQIKIIETEIPPFSIKELLFFPSKILKIINSHDAFYSPYINIPSSFFHKIKIPIFTTIHDVVFLDVKGLSSLSGTLIRKYFYQRAINKSKKIFTVSEFSKNRIESTLHIGKKEIVVTYNSVPEWFRDSFYNEGCPPCKELKSLNEDCPPCKKLKSLNEDCPSCKELNSSNEDCPPCKKYSNTLLFVGNIKKHKGLKYLINAFEIVQKTIPEIKLIIVGNEKNFRSSDDEILGKISEIKNIEFTGKISNQELKNLYSKVNLLVQPSLYEGFGMPPLEALYCKTNVLLSDIPVFKEIYEKFPVTYFKSEDSLNLSEKIIECLKLKSPENIPDVYSFTKTSDIIIKNILGETN